MAQEYLPAPSNVRLADLMKEHNISQPELAKEIGCSKSTISRFISGAKGTLCVRDGLSLFTAQLPENTTACTGFLVVGAENLPCSSAVRLTQWVPQCPHIPDKTWGPRNLTV